MAENTQGTSRAAQLSTSIDAANTAVFEDISLHFRCLRDLADRAIQCNGNDCVGILWAISHLAERWAAESQSAAERRMQGEVSARHGVAS